jgi:hypothetical protein
MSSDDEPKVKSYSKLSAEQAEGLSDPQRTIIEYWRSLTFPLRPRDPMNEKGDFKKKYDNAVVYLDKLQRDLWKLLCTDAQRDMMDYFHRFGVSYPEFQDEADAKSEAFLQKRKKAVVEVQIDMTDLMIQLAKHHRLTRTVVDDLVYEDVSGAVQKRRERWDDIHLTYNWRQVPGTQPYDFTDAFWTVLLGRGDTARPLDQQVKFPFRQREQVIIQQTDDQAYWK